MRQAKSLTRTEPTEVLFRNKIADDNKELTDFVQGMLILFHANHCKSDKDCTVIPQCHIGKNVWNHVKFCKLVGCLFPHCLESKMILAHFQFCENKDSCIKCRLATKNLVGLKKMEEKFMAESETFYPSCGVCQESGVDESKSDSDDTNGSKNSPILKRKRSQLDDEKQAINTMNENLATKKQHTEESKAEAIQNHLALLNHTILCGNVECSSKNCGKMKELIHHYGSCEVDNCQLCRRINNLYTLHNKSCPTGLDCPLSRCRELSSASKLDNSTTTTKVDSVPPLVTK